MTLYTIVLGIAYSQCYTIYLMRTMEVKQSFTLHDVSHTF